MSIQQMLPGVQQQEARTHPNQDRLFMDQQQAGFRYVGTTLSGRVVKGYVDVDDENAARQVLAKGRISIQEGALLPRASSAGRSRRRVTREELGLFATQLADRLAAGEPMPTAIRGEARATRNRMLQAALTSVADTIQRSGTSSADAFKMHPDAFPEYFCHTIRLGEQKGDPTELLRDYGQGQIRIAETLAKLKGAMYYPLAVLGVALIVVAILVYFVIPKMQEIYDALLEASGGKLPFLTRALLAVAHFATSIAGIAVLVVIILSIASLVRWAKGPGKETAQRSSLNWPIAGPLIRQFNASYTVRSIGLLLDATDLNTALKLTAEARLNVVYGEMIEDILEVVRTHGMTLSDALAPYAHLMGDEMNGIVSAGESSGKVTQQFIRYANMLDERIRRQVESMSRVIEPLMIVAVAAIIAPIIIASYLPLFELIGQLAGK